MRLPTAPTLRKEVGATADEIANTDHSHKAAKKYGKEKIKEVRDILLLSRPRIAAAAAAPSRWRAGH